MTSETLKVNRKVVFALGYAQFKSWCKKNNLNPMDSRRVIFASSRASIQGLSSVEAVFLHRWWDNDQYKDSEDLIRRLIADCANTLTDVPRGA